jgi:hypothetical protein
MGSDAFISWSALYCDWLLDAKIEDGLTLADLTVDILPDLTPSYAIAD